MNKIYRILLTLMGVIWVDIGMSQNATVTFEYDDCGNRIERILMFQKVENSGRSTMVEDDEEWLARVEENFEGHSMSLYPNPTSGKFLLVLGEGISSAIQAVLCTSGGVVIETRQVNNHVEEFDLSERSAGVYVLRLTSGQKTKTWKIIKR